MKLNLAKSVCALFLVATAIRATAQSTWNYFISDAGGGNSLVTWNVIGSFNTAPGEFVLAPQSRLDFSVAAPGIYRDSFVAGGAPQVIPAADGSHLSLGGGDVYQPVVLFETFNASGANNDSFGLSTGSLPPHFADPGTDFVYQPGTQSIVIPVDYFNFNPGTYSSIDSVYSPTLTVNLTIGPVPEPSTLALSGLDGLAGCLFFRRRA